jgi:hypothetical protein
LQAFLVQEEIMPGMKEKKQERNTILLYKRKKTKETRKKLNKLSDEPLYSFIL